MTTTTKPGDDTMAHAIDLQRRRFMQYAGLGFLALSGAPGLTRAMTSASLARASPNFHPDVELELVSRNASLTLLPGSPTAVMKYDAHVLSGPPDTLMDIPGSYLGPLLRFHQGQKVRIRYRNEMTQPSIAHWHGLHVPAAADGHPMYAVQRGESYVYEFEVLNRAGTYIYHSHAHEQTAEQVYFGLASGIVVSDDDEKRLGLPSGEFDLPVVIQDRAFDTNNQLVYVTHHMEQMTGFHGDRILINGSLNNEFQVASRAYRLRLVNGSNARIYKLAWDDGTPITVIGTDGGLLENPETRPYVMLAPGERLDLWADFSGRAVGSELVMRSKPFHGVLPGMAQNMLSRHGAPEGQGGGMGHGMMGGMGHGMMGGMGRGGSDGEHRRGGGMMGGMGGMMNIPHMRLPLGSDYPVFKIRVTHQVSDSLALPARLSTIHRLTARDTANPSKPLPLAISEGPMSMLLNGRPYHMDDVQDFEKVKVNTIQLMEIFHSHGGGHGGPAGGEEHGGGEGGGMMGGMGHGGGGMGAMMAMAHPIHMHGQQFQILSRRLEGQSSEAYDTVREGFIDSGWKDTALTMPGERITLVKPFQDYTGRFMYHCHNLEHEDMGMMREFEIVP